MRLASALYYAARPLLPRRVQVAVRRARCALLRRRFADRWPIDERAEPKAPPLWPGWPGGKRFALVLTHDVETAAGVERSARVAALEHERGMRSAFAFVPRRYRTPARLRDELARSGFEVMVHGLHHDGKLFQDPATFHARAEAINTVLSAWGVRGFAAPAAHHDFRWMGALDVDHDVSSYDHDPFEPQPCGVGRVFPFWVAAPGHPRGGFVELPYTLAQDFTVFVMMRESGIGMWTRKLSWIADSGGMALLKTHPDYMAFGRGDRTHERYDVQRYLDFLDHVRAVYGDDVWVALPSEVAAYWRSISVQQGVVGRESLEPADTFCPMCRAAHRDGVLMEYAPTVPAPGRDAVTVPSAPGRSGMAVPHPG